MGRRVICHTDADAFYASVHHLQDPTLDGKPVVVAGDGPRSVVTTANYEARKYGIGSAQPAARARRLCPHAVFLKPDFELYRRYSSQAMEIMRRYTDTIEPVSLDEAYLDITHLDRPIAAMREMVAAIKDATGLQYSVGIGPNKLCAKALSDHLKPAAFNVASREQCCELFAGRPPRLIPGIGPKTAQRLEEMGIPTIAALRDASQQRLAAAFGPRHGGELQARARFEHDSAVQAHRDPKSKSEETTFDYDVDDPEELETAMRALADELCQRLADRDLQGRTVSIKVRLDDFTTVTRAKTIDHPTRDPGEVWRIARELLWAYDPPRPVRLIGVRVASFEKPADDDPDTEQQAAQPHVGEQLRLAV